ncbi:helix-turn-helix domain-containing protein, partial [Actinoallomurus iriomotensis]|uniref:helix-turn-helix domain-containing protein n=1 Tax=Actinoallomurus iriomotensis TaxID=478107 RepID=UPI003D7FFA13
MTAPRVKRAFKYRFYPTDAQAAELSRTFGCVRKVDNLALEARTEAWRTRREHVGYNATSARPLPHGARPSTVTVSQDSAGRWFVSLLCEDPDVQPLPAGGDAVGVDAG